MVYLESLGLVIGRLTSTLTVTLLATPFTAIDGPPSIERIYKGF